MKHFKRITALLLVLALVLVPLAALAEGEPAEAAETVQLPIGSSGYAITVPAGYSDVGVNNEEFALGAVSNYMNSDTAIDIEVYEFPAKTEGFEAFAAAQCELFNGTDFTAGKIAELPAAAFRTVWSTAEGVSNNIAVLIDTGKTYVEIDFFWAAEEDKLDACIEMAKTFAKADTQFIRLGSSPYVVSALSGYYSGEVTSEEAAEGLIEYYLNDSLLFDFDIYENPIPEGYELSDVAIALCEANKGSGLTMRSFNGIPAYTFNGYDIYDGVKYDTVTCVLDSTNGTAIGIVCWLDNEAMRVAAEGLLSTLNTADTAVKDEPMVLRIGSSSLCISLPTTFVEAVGSEEEFKEEGYLGNYYSPYGIFDFDLYQCPVADELPTLEEFVMDDCNKYNGTELALDEEINGIAIASYSSVEVYDEISYQCETYTFQEGAYYYQLCFYWTDADAKEDVEAAIATLAPIEKKAVQLGASPYSVTVPADVEVMVEESEDESLSIVRYSAPSFAFTVYELTNPEVHYTLEEYAKLEAEYYEGTELTFSEINGVPVASYYYTHSDKYYNNVATLTYCIENGGNSYIDIDFYIEDYVSMYQALDVISTLTK